MSERSDHQKNLAKLLRENACRYRLHEVFRDFCELGALAYSNQFSRHKYEAREARYLDIVGRYQPDEVARFPQMLAELTMSLRASPRDALGELFMSLELGDSGLGQFFTSHEVSCLMAAITMSDVAAVVAREGFFTMCEPACGAGGMVIACAAIAESHGLDPRQVMHATATDIDATAVHMAYLQLSILGIPAVVVHGNTLTVQEWDQWATPAHVLGGWTARLRRRCAAAAPTSEPARAMGAITTEQATVAAQLGQMQLFV